MEAPNGLHIEVGLQPYPPSKFEARSDSSPPRLRSGALPRIHRASTQGVSRSHGMHRGLFEVLPGPPKAPPCAPPVGFPNLFSLRS